MNYTIEQAKPKHLSEIKHLNKLLFDKEIIDFDETLDPDWTFGKEAENYFKNTVTENNYISFVALVDDKVVGYIIGKIADMSIPCRIIRNQAELSHMFILEDYRSEKIGSDLVKSFIEVVAKRGIKNIKVVASAANYKAISFYRKHGFRDYDLTLELNLSLEKN